MVETAVLVLTASVTALLFAQSCLYAFKELAGKPRIDGQIIQSEFLLIIGITAVATLVLSGLQPAWQLSGFKPLEALGAVRRNSQKVLLRRALVIFQFSCSVALIFCTVVMLMQMKFLRNKNLGLDYEQVFSFLLTEHADRGEVQRALMEIPAITDITLSDNSIVNLGARYGGFTYEGKPEDFNPYLWRIAVDENFHSFFDIKMSEGRWFLPGNHDTTSFIINETAVKELQMESPIGTPMTFGGVTGMIVGVVQDFHFRSLHEEVEQLIMVQNPAYMPRVYVKTTGTQVENAIAAAEKVFLSHEPYQVFDYTFLDKSFQRLYQAENRASTIFLLFACLAILISCLGMIGLTAYATERRKKEVSIRKVLGASISGLLFLLSKDFLKLVFFSIILTCPIAWYMMQTWLRNFAYHIELRWWIVLITGLIIVGISLTTVGFQTIKAAIANPTRTLMRE